MHDRYTRREMRGIWSEEVRWGHVLHIWVLAAEAMEERGEIPKGVAASVRKSVSVDTALIASAQKIEEKNRHDLIAFHEAVNERAGEPGRHLHFGMTSSDVLDTATALQLMQASTAILAQLTKLMDALRKRAYEHKDTVCIGRSHGIHAEPTIFGLKLALFYDELQRAQRRFIAATEEISVGAISGAVGTYATVHPDVDAYVCAKLGLKPAPITTQVISRDRHAAYITAIALLASVVEQLAVELRHLQRTEVREVEEKFELDQKGSSAMPHKRNPISSENITGLCRWIRSQAQPAMENVLLWHERDISHSSVERIMFPQVTAYMQYVLHRMTGVMKNLVISPDRMRKNIQLTNDLWASQRLTLALITHGMTREDAYACVRHHAMAVWEQGGSLRERMLPVLEKHGIDPEVVAPIFDPLSFVQHRDLIFQRVFPDLS